jgi:flagellar hook-associated protein 2
MATPSLDINSIVSQLMTVERQPLSKFAAREAGQQARLTAYGSVKSAVSGFQSAINGLNSVARFQSLTATPSDKSFFTASATSIAVAGTYSLEVNSLAQAQQLVAAGQTSSIAAIGGGTATTLSFDFGTVSGGTLDAGTYTGATFTSNGKGTKTLVIDSSNNSLQGIRDAINAAKIGVKASLVNDGSGTPYRLTLAADSAGAANSMKISVDGDATIGSLLAHDPAGTQNLNQTVAAQNASLKVNGIAVSKASNSVSDVIAGVTLNLIKVTESPQTLTVARDTSSITASINSFVKAYNDLAGTLKNLSAYDAASKKGAILQGDATVRSLQNQLRGILGSSVAGTPGNLKTLSSIGVSFQLDGTLAVDSARLNDAMTNNFDEIASLFATVGRSSDSLVSFSSAGSSVKPGVYAVNVTQLATQGRTVGGSAITAPLDIVAGVNDTLELSVDGVAASITLTAGNYSTVDALMTELQAKINGASELSTRGISVAVTEATGTLTLTSGTYGSNASVSITGGNAAASLGLDGDTPTAGVDVAGTIGGVTATGAGQLLRGTSGAAQGLDIIVNGGALGDRGSISYSQGLATTLAKWAASATDSGSAITARTEGINKTIEDIGKRREELEARLVVIEKRLRAQYTALDAMLSNMNTTSNFLTSQLASLPGSQNNG